MDTPWSDSRADAAETTCTRTNALPCGSLSLSSDSHSSAALHSRRAPAITTDAMDIVAAAFALIAFVYLIVVLLDPERFDA